ncbi:MAG: hypothetical protein HC939_15425 [Pleurocapsa sp. SU_5_0]|nr:hypothetical protein [Pleurocapsa sp. SU_5_0]
MSKETRSQYLKTLFFGDRFHLLVLRAKHISPTQSSKTARIALGNIDSQELLVSKQMIAQGRKH